METTINKNSVRTSGFTLLEIAIVLVIIGLITGGVFVGQVLVKNAQINAVIQEYGRYQSATQSFKEQYRALPGDYASATTVWGIAGGTGSDATCKTTTSTTTATCNGDANGTIDSSTGSNEFFRYWQHLASAKMIEGFYTGVYNGTSSTPGTNVPNSKYVGAGWSVASAPNYSAGSSAAPASSWFTTDYGTGHVFIFGAAYAGVANLAGGINTGDAYGIDTKIDDGKPATGNVISNYYGASASTSCTTVGSGIADLTVTYVLTNKNPKCFLFFVPNF